jgi:hypothetical protein
MTTSMPIRCLVNQHRRPPPRTHGTEQKPTARVSVSFFEVKRNRGDPSVASSNTPECFCTQSTLQLLCLSPLMFVAPSFTSFFDCRLTHRVSLRSSSSLSHFLTDYCVAGSSCANPVCAENGMNNTLTVFVETLSHKKTTFPFSTLYFFRFDCIFSATRIGVSLHVFCPHTHVDLFGTGRAARPCARDTRTNFVPGGRWVWKPTSRGIGFVAA